VWTAKEKIHPRPPRKSGCHPCLAGTARAPVKIPLIRRYFLPSSLSRGLPRNWTRANLPALPGRRLLYHSATVRTFLATNNANRRRPCPPGMFYCFRCRERRKPALGLVDYADRPAGAGNLTAIYESCGTIMNRRARREALPTIIPGLDVNIRHAPATLAGNHSPPTIVVLRSADRHDKTQHCKRASEARLF
jgi:hypothetical protein